MLKLVGKTNGLYLCPINVYNRQNFDKMNLEYLNAHHFSVSSIFYRSYQNEKLREREREKLEFYFKNKFLSNECVLSNKKGSFLF